MKRTKRRDLCQHCGEHPATLTITWRWTADCMGIEEPHDDEEDWCAECAAASTGPIVDMQPISLSEDRSDRQ
jgi:hypothetical protein